MFIKKITIKNFRLFPTEDEFEIDDINIPDAEEGSGLNVFVGENGSGKSALLEAFSLPILEYKTRNFGIDNFNDIKKEIEIKIYSQEEFNVEKTVSRGSFDSFKAKGFYFKAHMRKKGNKSYLSSILVYDQQYISADISDPSDISSPREGSSDWRVNVNNPFGRKRFDETDVLFLDRNRTSQTKLGNFSTTRFDRLMEDFNYQYLKNIGDGITDLNDGLDDKIRKNNEEIDNKIGEDKIQNKFLSEAISKFQKISNLEDSEIRLDFLNNHEPFNNAFFAAREGDTKQISISNLGSGYEMIFALLYSFYLARQSDKKLIVLIDEPELHLHPRLQKNFVEFLLESSKEAQIFLTSHSPLLVKQLSENDKVKIQILRKNKQKISEIDKGVLSYTSANEINFLAFNLATEEYHNELYEELKYNYDNREIDKICHENHEVNESHKKSATKSYKEFDNAFFVNKKGEEKDSPLLKVPNQVSRHTFIRNQIHHRKENGKANDNDLKESIERMRSFF